MPFIGQSPVTGAYHKLDSITTSATATYNLLLNGGAYYPASANNLLVSLNGVMQAPQDSFTVSGSQITFASALTSSDVIDFIMALGDVLNIGTPSDGSVNTSQLANSAVTTAKMASTLDLSGKTMTYGNLPAGNLTGTLPALNGSALTGIDGVLVKRQFSSWTTNTSSTTNTSWASAHNFSYTPVASGNKLIVHAVVRCGIQLSSSSTANYAAVFTRVNIAGTGGQESKFWARNDGVTYKEHTGMNYNVDTYLTTSTSAITIGVDWYTADKTGSSTSGVNQWTAPSYIEVMEFSGNVTT